MKRIYFVIMLLFCGLGTWAQTITISGKVLNAKGEPVMGATIQAKGNAASTLSDEEGSFTLKVKDAKELLAISNIGYTRQEIAIPKNKIIQITLLKDNKNLSEVTIKGFSSANSRARRRAESVQRIPESVTTFTSEQIENTGVKNVQSFAALVPNVSFNTSQNVGVNFVTVRGISQIRNGDAPVAFVVDDVTVPDANLINQDLFDLALIEVVKGPQGALYGKNAIGGAINIYTNTPTNTYQNKINVGYSNGNTYTAQGSFSGPILKDKIFYRVSGSYKHSDGVIYNSFLKRDVDFLRDFTGRVQLKFNFTSNITTTVSAQNINTKGGATYYAHTKSNADGRMGANDFNNVIDGDQLGESTLKNSFISQNTQIKGAKVIFKIITSLNIAKRYHQGDLDFGPSDILRQYQNSNSNTFNQEFRLSDNKSNSKFKWTVGGFYQNNKKYLFTKATADFGFFASPYTASGVQSTLATLSDFTNTYNTLAAFGFMEYKLAKKLTASVGLRFDNDHIKQNNNVTKTTPSKVSNELQPKISISYQANDQFLGYVNYGRGYRSGGYNSGQTKLFDAEYAAETSNNYEVGIKTSTKDNRLVFNASAFIIDFDNQQQYVVTTGVSGLILGNYNLKKTKITGFEADVKWRTSKFLDVLAGYGKSKSEIKEGGFAGSTDYSKYNGNITPWVPASTYYVALQNNSTLSKTIDLNVFVSLNGKGKTYWHENNIDASNPFSLLDARAGIIIHKKVGITLWGKNILDKQYYQEYYSKLVSGGGYDIGWRGLPGTYGIEVSVKF